MFICLNFDGNALKIGTHTTNLAREYTKNIFWLAMKSELCIPKVQQSEVTF